MERKAGGRGKRGAGGRWREGKEELKRCTERVRPQETSRDPLSIKLRAHALWGMRAEAVGGQTDGQTHTHTCAAAMPGAKRRKRCCSKWTRAQETVREGGRKQRAKGDQQRGRRQASTNLAGH